MSLDFDLLVERKGTGSVKTSMAEMFFGFGAAEAIPLWVADQDWRSPKFVVDAIQRRLETPVFGYSTTDDTLLGAIQNWMKVRFDWHIERHWIKFSPGFVRFVVSYYYYFKTSI